MQMPARLIFAAALATIVLTTGAPAVADEDHIAARRLRESGEILSLEKIAEQARSAKAGEILETELEQKKGRYIYEVEILDKEGQVWELKLDAKTGNLIKMEIDD